MKMGWDSPGEEARGVPGFLLHTRQLVPPVWCHV